MTEAVDGSALTTIALLAFGCWIADAVTGRCESRPFERLLGALLWGPGLAAGLVSLVSFFGLALGPGRPGRWVLLGVLAAAAGMAWLQSGGVHVARELRVPRRDDHGFGARFGTCALAALAAGYGWTYVCWLAQRPLGSYDGMAIWTYRALQWFRSGEAFPATVGLLVESKPDYPLLLPGLMTAQFTLWGGESVAIPVATGWFFLVGLGAAVTLAVVRWSPRGVALAAAALVLSTPMVWRWAFAQSADLALSSLTLAAAFGLSELVLRRPRSPVPAWLVGFHLGLMVWTKNEGMILAPILVAVWGTFSWLDRRGLSVRTAGGLILGAVPPVVATIIYKIGWISVGEVGRFFADGWFDRFTDAARWQTVVSAFADRLIPWSDGSLWGGTPVVIVIVFVVAAFRSTRRGIGRTAVPYAASAAVAVCCFAFIYLVTPDPLAWHLATSLDRLLLQVAPLAAVAAFTALGRGVGDDEEIQR